MNILTILGSAASYATTFTLSGIGVLFFGSWAYAILKGNVR